MNWFEEMEDKYIGKKGSVARKAYEQEVQMGIIAQTVRQLRKKRKLTREQLGELAGIQTAQVANIETVADSAGIDSIVKILKVLNANVCFTVKFKNKTTRLAGKASGK